MTMPIEVRLPELGDASTLARIGSWLKGEGDRVVAGEPLLEVETDQTSMEIEAPVNGILQKVLLPSGSEGVAPDAVLCLIGEAVVETTVSRVAQVETRPRTQTISNSQSLRPPALQSVATPPPVDAARPMLVESSPARSVPHATPLARTIAKLAGAELSRIEPADGVRIRRADVERAITKDVAPANRREAGAGDLPKVGPGVQPPYEDRPLSPLRRVTAARLQEAKQTVPHFYLETDCRVDDPVRMRREWNSRNGTNVTINDLIVFAASRALRQIPMANSAWAETALRVFSSVDIAVAVTTPAGLIAPVLRGAHAKSITTISIEMAELIERARAGRLKPSEYAGGTFTISNLGMFGVRTILPIINPPQACILGIGSTEQRPVVIRDQLAVGQMLTAPLQLTIARLTVPPVPSSSANSAVCSRIRSFWRSVRSLRKSEAHAVVLLRYQHVDEFVHRRALEPLLVCAARQNLIDAPTGKHP